MIEDLCTTVSIQGMSGTSYIFNLYGFTKFSELKDAFNEIPALYVFTRRSWNGQIYTHNIIYVGETERLSTRFYNHHKESCIMNNNANCICIHTFYGTQSERQAAETDILNAYDLPCNILNN